MTAERGFLHDILEHPDDDTPRLIYADWLDDRGDPRSAARAELIRLQCRLAGPTSEDDPERWALLEREAQLLRAHGKGWAGPLRRLVKRWWFRRGFVEGVALPATDFLRHADALFELAPIRNVRLLGEPIEVSLRRAPYRNHQEQTTWVLSLQRLLPELALCPRLAKVRGLNLSWQRFSLPAFEALLRSPYFPPLESLDLSGTAVCTDEGFRLLARTAQLATLTDLALSGRQHPREGYQQRTRLSGEAMAALASSPHLSRVRQLRLGCGASDLSAQAIRALEESPLLGRLTAFATSSAGFEMEPFTTWSGEQQEDELARLLRSPKVAGLRSLSLRRWLRRDVSLLAVVESPHLSNLRCLDLRQCVLDDNQTRALVAARHLVNLIELDLSACFAGEYHAAYPSYRGEERLQLLTGATCFPRLAALNLNENFLPAPAVREFAQGPLVGQLRRLEIQGPRAPLLLGRHETPRYLHSERRIGDLAAKVFAVSPRASGLVRLDLGNHRITDIGLKALAESPHLPSLMTLGLWNNEVEGMGVSALLASGKLPRLATIDLRSNPLPPAAQQALRTRFGYGVAFGRGPVPRGYNHRAARDEEEGDPPPNEEPSFFGGYIGEAPDEEAKG
jgi:uncharacterized protein (TIGR02996 family)